MRTPGVKTVRRAAHWLQSRFAQHAIILGYHRIADVLADPYDMAVTPDHFRQQLEVLRRVAKPVSLWHVVEGASCGSIPDRSVVLTFDDGYCDNFYTAKPLLEEFEIPAHVFISTGYIGRAFWWDQLAHLILHTPASPDTILPRDGFESAPRRNGIEPERAADGRLREELLSSTYRQVLRLPYPTQEGTLQQLATQVRDLPALDESVRAMTASEITLLSESDLIGIGAHTVSHPNLADLALEQQRQEISESKLCLEQLLGKDVNSFSYPNGSATQSTLELVESIGYACACSSQFGTVTSRNDRYCLPRFWMRNWNGPKFERWLELWL